MPSNPASSASRADSGLCAAIKVASSPEATLSRNALVILQPPPCALFILPLPHRRATLPLAIEIYRDQPACPVPTWISTGAARRFVCIDDMARSGRLLRGLRRGKPAEFRREMGGNRSADNRQAHAD